ncbi:ferredoxin--NADP reductase [Arthrobacter sp. W4I7]|uniref:ferredoxin--NADP reductase n=1 Tax=Arthrobacter sp. W4I7 TaxID=3042296 RepID=UPI0027891B81|nr:ferredoxin--NADP reductase [Arthrobacter sp. W4I7]MDQ0691382.1 3-ketosteroid 9alpha-monooxygenase subunit B [Arthrobacter sp. W4I7]
MMSNNGRPGIVVTVRRVIEETADARSLVIEVPDEHLDHFEYEPGQFLTLNVPSRLEPTARCYSLASSPYVDEPLKVTVKRTAGGYASNLLCDYPQVPFNIEVLKPSGTFTPKSLDGDFVLLAGGSGVTPIMSILKSVLHGGEGRCHMFYANRDEASTIFAQELASLEKQFPDRCSIQWWHEDERGGVPTAEAVKSALVSYSGAQVFTCGPGRFMELVRSVTHTLEIPHHQVHFEEFTSLGGDPFAPVEAIDLGNDADVSTVEIELDGSEYTLSWPPNRTLVDVMLNAGIDVPYSCRSGECGSCVCTLVKGTVDPGENDLLDAEDIEDGVILGCQAKPTSPQLKVEF